jgi:hypothetical protein
VGEQTNPVDQRKFPRKTLDVMVNYKKMHYARSKDISKGGICLIVDEQLESAGYLNLVFFLPNKEEIKALGKIKWCKKISESYFECGVEFFQLNDLETKKIESYLEESIS